MADKNLRYDRLLAAARQRARVRMGVIHPCSREALEGARSAARLGLARDGEVGALMKGSLHSDELLAEGVKADVLIVPDLESGNMLAKQLEYLGDAQAAGGVMGARVPIVLTSRADSAHSRIASCAIAKLLADHYREAPP